MASTGLWKLMFSGARSWLRTADTACERWQRQLLLIANNIGSQMITGSNVYMTIIQTWHNAMRVLEKLIVGVPQRVQQAEILLGLSAWHLYPDMVVVHDTAKLVSQKDELIAAGGIMTLGLHVPGEEDAQGIKWSLPLSHLRYYGKPVQSSRDLSLCTSRINFEQFSLLSLGSLTRSWAETFETVVRLIFALSNVWRKEDRVMPKWLKLFFETVQWYSSLAGREKQTAEQIFFFGRRRCGNLFDTAQGAVEEGFGLCSVENFVKALPGAESRIAWLRNYVTTPSIADDMPPNAIITYCPDNQDQVKPSLIPGSRTPHIVTEFASLSPVNMANNTVSHRRWIPANEITWEAILSESVQDPTHSSSQPCFDICQRSSVNRMTSLQNTTAESCGLYHSGGNRRLADGHAIPSVSPIPPRNLDQLRSSGLALIGMPGCSVDCESFDFHLAGDSDPPNKKRKLTYNLECTHRWYLPSLESILNQKQPSTYPTYCGFGDISTAAICLPIHCAAASRQERLSKILDVEYVISELENGRFSAESLSPCLANLARGIFLSDSTAARASVEAWVVASEIFRDLPNATIDIGVTSRPLCESHWLSTTASAVARRFSCIAMFESGGLNIHPTQLEDVIAISSSNSLYIAAYLLHDPWNHENIAQIVHTVGNVGRAGVCFLISPTDLLVKEPERDKWQLVRHAPYNGQLESNLTGTTLHLSFTGYELPLQTANHGAFDKEAFFVEATVRVFDKREWVADIDLNAAYRIAFKKTENKANGSPLACCLLSCEHPKEEQTKHNNLNLISVDSWIELLDPSMAAFVVRAKGDWISRLAVFAVAMQTKRPVVIAVDYICWPCVQSLAPTLTPRGFSVDDLWKGIEGPKLMVLC